MASKRRLRRKACGDKIRHASKGMAWQHAWGLRRKYDDPRVHAYRCPFCKNWHVGH